MKFIIIFLLLVPILKPQTFGEQELILPAIFSDNMVLQRNTEVLLWGEGKPGKSVLLTAGWGAKAETKVNSDSSWETKIKTGEAGGPYTLKIKIDDSSLEYKNVMLGEVWLCSGQSNMEMPLEGWPPQNLINNSTQEIKEADYPQIRLYTVTRAVSNKPEFNCVGNWNECTPQTAAKFSASAYFFGKELYKELNVPIGLIVSSWGGTKVQSWISRKYISGVEGYKNIVEKIDSAGPAIEKLNSWIERHPVVDVSRKNSNVRWKDIDLNDIISSKPEFNDSAWKSMELPALWETADIGDFDGIVWFRKKIKIPQSWQHKDLVLNLGAIDDMDRTYVNGVFVGGIEEEGQWQTPRIYNVPKELIKDTILTIAVRVIDNQGGGGLYGNGVEMKICTKEDSTEKISLIGSWKYLPVAEYLNNKFYVYNVKGEEFYSRPKSAISIGANTPTMLYNGMIAPVVPYTIKGVIWYQGEANVDLPVEYNNYEDLFSLMIKNWREDWDEGDFPFYFVQIAPYNYGENSKSYVVRDAQRRTLTVANTGMAVTLDIGEVNNIHPADKQDVGKRLSLWALEKNYGKEDIIYSGPLYKAMEIHDNKIILSFDHTEGGLVVKEIDGKNNFEIAGADSNFVNADVKVDGDNLIVSSNSIKNPAAVRYAWSNTAEATLFNKAGLPASTFITDKNFYSSNKKDNQ